MKSARRALCAFAVLATLAVPAWAKDWPTDQPIRIVVPYPAGGNADSAARAVAAELGPRLGQNFIIENRPGASSIIGSDNVARSRPDGYTLGVVSDSHAINQAMGATPRGAEVLGAAVPYDAIKDFTPVSGMIEVPLVLVVNPSIPARSLEDVVAYSNDAQRQGMNFGTMGTGSPWSIHLHQLNALTGAHFVDVPYKGLAPAATALLGSQIDTMLMPVHYAQQHIQASKLIPVVTLGEARHPLLPDVPTVAESGYPGFAISNYLYFVAPAGTPAAVVDRLNQEVQAVLALPAMKDKLSTSGDPYLVDASTLSERLRSDIDTYGAVIQKTLK